MASDNGARLLVDPLIISALSRTARWGRSKERTDAQAAARRRSCDRDRRRTSPPLDGEQRASIRTQYTPLRRQRAR